MMAFFIAISGLFLLLGGAELLVRGASRLARMMEVSPLLVGLTVVAFGTSAPELAVSIKTGLSGQSEIAVGNVLGSNIFNILFILGISALLTPLFVTSRLVRIDVPVMIIISALAWFLARNGVIGHIECAFMLVVFVVYTGAIAVFSRRHFSSGAGKTRNSAIPLFGVKAFAASLAGILLGLGLLAFGARWLVAGASGIARQFGVSELIIGLTLVAAGTSLPEAATSLVASLRRERDIAVGNIVGSNIFNILCVLAVGGLFAPGGLDVSEISLEFDMPIMLAVALVCLPVFVTGGSVSRREGVFFLSYYVLYLVLLGLRATDSRFLPLATNVMIFVVFPATGLMLFFSLLRSYREIIALANAIGGNLSAAGWYAIKNARKALVLVVGLTLIMIGLAMMVLPGPGTVVIPMGLAVLATEFLWARRLLNRMYAEVQKAARRFIGGKEETN